MATKEPAALARKPIHWANDASHVGALISSGVPVQALLAVVVETRDHLIAFLESVEPESPLEMRPAGHQVRFIQPPGHPERPDLRDPDFGILYCLHFESHLSGRGLAAVKLLARCLHILERGDFVLQDRVAFMAEYQAMAGIDAVGKQDAARKPRRQRQMPALYGHLKEVHAQYPEEKLDDLLQRLQHDDHIIKWEPEAAAHPTIDWVDPKGRIQTTVRSTVKGWFTAINKGKSARS